MKIKDKIWDLLIWRPAEKKLLKMKKRGEEISGEHLIDEEEIRKQLIVRGKELTEDLWGRVRPMLILTILSIVVSVIFPPFAELIAIFGFFLIISGLGFQKHNSKFKKFSKDGEYWEEPLELARIEDGRIWLHGKVNGYNVFIYGSEDDIHNKKATLYGYSMAIPTTIVAITDENGIGNWYDPIDDSDD